MLTETACCLGIEKENYTQSNERYIYLLDSMLI